VDHLPKAAKLHQREDPYPYTGHPKHNCRLSRRIDPDSGSFKAESSIPPTYYRFDAF
jgi:hypothetical protein